MPGVSGGTIAFISGIYEELINTIKAFDLGLMKAVFQGKWKSASRKANLIFLIPLLIGMLGGIVIGIFAIDYLIHAYPVMVWSFFVGLILASAYFIIRQVKQWNWLSITFLFLGILIAFLISNLPVSAVNISLPFAR